MEGLRETTAKMLRETTADGKMRETTAKMEGLRERQLGWKD